MIIKIFLNALDKVFQFHWHRLDMVGVSASSEMINGYGWTLVKKNRVYGMFREWLVPLVGGSPFSLHRTAHLPLDTQLSSVAPRR